MNAHKRRWEVSTYLDGCRTVHGSYRWRWLAQFMSGQYRRWPAIVGTTTIAQQTQDVA